MSTALLAFRSNIEPIVQRIAHVLPGLTVHDVTHLDALWDTAGVISGVGYPLNPLEAFVFGAAVLLHDSAMCWEAFERGIDGVRGSIEWRDAYAAECDAAPDNEEAGRLASADFSALRALHAHQAAKLPEMVWTHPDTGDAIHLIEDVQLRTDLGRLAGRIASSHHWDIDALAPSLGEQFNAPSPFPSEWAIDPVKVACLLRCADAAHINQARAPLFLYALVKRQGISLQHWTAQSRMMGPSLDVGDLSGSAIVYTASRPFKESEASAWWIAHDAVVTVDREIRQSNALLRGRQRPATAPEFQVRRVTGADSIEDLTQHLPVEGWTPCKAEPHVSNVESLVRELGGEKLYGAGGESFQVVLRELLQNARDAIVARRFVEEGFAGELTVRFTESDDQLWLFVEDNGVGMSRRVMMGPLLDFGQSFWKSSLIQTEFPGLRSSRFRSIGRFGIGFYSVFMVASRVEVTSKQWDKGLDDCNSLIFGDGVSLRPILRKGRVPGLSSQVSTRVALRLKDGWLRPTGDIEVKPAFMGAAAIPVSVYEYVAALVVGLDVRVAVDSPWGGKREVHGGEPGTAPDSTEILHRIAFSGHQCSSVVDQAIARNHARLRPIRSGDHTFGVAAISTVQNSAFLLLGLQTIGGLATSIQARHAGSFVGYIDHKAGSARRDASVFEAPTEVMQAWGAEQLRLLEDSALDDLERSIAGVHALEFGCDPTAFGRLLISVDGLGQRFMTYAEVATLAASCPVGFLKMQHIDHIESHTPVPQLSGIALFVPLVNSKALNVKIVGGQPFDLHTVVGCLDRAIAASGRLTNWEVRQAGFASTVGGSLEILSVSSSSL
ncbi:HD domain-containing protein [Methylibium sp.]|uniref:HD domain-containing protein n=1 Tax=Methylibium sp. TaxID=2067992 RepID=UPI003D142159